MTGEITLTGHVLPVGGIKEKVLAAGRAGIKSIILPSSNEPQLHEIPQRDKRGLKFILAETVEDVWKAALFAAPRGGVKSRGST